MVLLNRHDDVRYRWPALRFENLCMFIFCIFYFIMAIPQILRRPRLNVYYLLGLGFGLGVGFYFYDVSRFFRDQILAVVQLDLAGTLSTRIGEEGYLIKSGTVEAMLQPIHLLVGMGNGVSGFAWSDNGYFQVVMYGGLGFFIFFFGYLLYICYLFAQSYREKKSRLFLALYGALFVGNVGTLVFLFPRTGLMLAFFTMLILNHIERRDKHFTLNHSSQWRVPGKEGSHGQLAAT